MCTNVEVVLLFTHNIQGFADFLPHRFFTHAHATLKFEFVAGAWSSGIMDSCKHSRSSAYGEDLHWRIVWQKEGLGLSDDTIASNVNIDKSTMSRTMQRFITTGTVAKLPYPKERVNRKLTDPAKLFIVLKSPGITFYEILEELLHTLLTQIDVSNICRLLQQNGFTRQKLKICALQQSEFLRQCFMEKVSIYNPEMLIFFR